MKSAGPAGVLVAAVLLQLAQPGLPTYAARPTCYVVSSLERVTPDAPLPANPTTEIDVSAAGNEYEGVQLIIHGGDNGLAGVDVEAATPLTTSSGLALASGTVTLYREHYVSVRTPSGGSVRATPGVYPDALIPFRNPFTGESLGRPGYPAAGFNVPARTNQPIYVEFYVPPSARPGVYHSTLRVIAAEAGQVAEIPVSVRVWGFTLPAASSLRTSFQSYDADYSLGAAAYYGYAQGSADHVAMATAIDEMLIAHRLVPTTPMGTVFRVARNGSVIPTPEQTERILWFLQRPAYTDFRIPFYEGFPFSNLLTYNRERAKNYLRSALEWMQANGLGGKLYLRPGDEPASTDDFIKIHDIAALAHEADPSIRVGMTVTLTGEKTQQHLFGSVNLLIAAYSEFDPGVGAARLAAGDELWTYTALVQNDSSPSPFWEIDFPLLNHRVVSWINFRHGATGLLYWTSANWQGAMRDGDSPWDDPRSSCFGATCYNGEGMLVYPGREIGLVVPEGAYEQYSPTAVYGVAPSLRLKALRDAMEDYEYLTMAASVDSGAAMARALEVGCAGDPVANCFHHWSRDSDVLLNVRLALGEFIESAQHTRPGTRTNERTANRSLRGR